MTKRFYRNKGRKENIVISIAGAHGVGKTTLFNLLKKELKDNNKFKFYPERYVKNPPFPFGSGDPLPGFGGLLVLPATDQRGGDPPGGGEDQPRLRRRQLRAA